jgi:hypothetical protein
LTDLVAAARRLVEALKPDDAAALFLDLKRLTPYL